MTAAYIEFFDNPQRKHVRNGMLSPIAFERQQKLKPQGVYKSRGYSGSIFASVKRISRFHTGTKTPAGGMSGMGNKIGAQGCPCAPSRRFTPR